VTKPNNKSVPKKWKITSMDVVWCEGWYVKASITSFGIICLVIYNDKTDDCHVRFFEGEEDANRFIEHVVSVT